jgi:hypothetical protein
MTEQAGVDNIELDGKRYVIMLPDKYDELMQVKRECEKLKKTLDEAKILASLVSEYDLLDTSPLNYESLNIELSDRVSRAWHALELLRNY